MTTREIACGRATTHTIIDHVCSPSTPLKPTKCASTCATHSFPFSNFLYIYPHVLYIFVYICNLFSQRTSLFPSSYMVSCVCPCLSQSQSHHTSPPIDLSFSRSSQSEAACFTLTQIHVHAVLRSQEVKKFCVKWIEDDRGFRPIDKQTARFCYCLLSCRPAHITYPGACMHMQLASWLLPSSIVSAQLCSKQQQLCLVHSSTSLGSGGRPCSLGVSKSIVG